MAEYLSPVFCTVKIAVRLCSLLLAAGAAAAQSLPDPTRPPGSLATAPDAEAVDGVSSAPLLQSVIISPGRRVAIIAGQTVKQGDKFGDAKVVRITENEVVLRNGDNVQTLKLFPNIEKQPSLNHRGTHVENRGNKGKS